MAHLKAVMFDIGGVVLNSPFIAIAEYERELGLPSNYLNCSITARGNSGAWQAFERGEIALLEFYQAFSRDLSDHENGNVWYKDYCRRRGIECPILPDSIIVDGRELFGRMMRQAATTDKHILPAIHKIRASRRWKLIALTNNFAKLEDDPSVTPAELAFLGWTEGTTMPSVRILFDDYCDSSTMGMRKPEPRFYLAACERNGVRPQEVVFLDDIRMNLKAARNLGMETIHVPLYDSLSAVKALEKTLGIPLTDGSGSHGSSQHLGMSTGYRPSASSGDKSKL